MIPGTVGVIVVGIYYIVQGLRKDDRLDQGIGLGVIGALAALYVTQAVLNAGNLLN